MNNQYYDQLQEKLVTVELSDWNSDRTTNGIDPVLLAPIKSGSQVTDYQDVVVAQVEKLEVRPAKRITMTDSGVARLVEDPYFKEASLRLKLQVHESLSVDYYMIYYKVKVGETIPLYFDNVVYDGLITDIEN